MELNNMSMKKVFNVATLSAAIALISACSDPSNPDGGTSLSSTSVSGVAIDGYLAHATVYADLNNNGRLDSGEPSALTDADGYFSTAMDGTTDYCASSSTEKHCLQIAGTVPDSVTIRTEGGFDIFTGEPFIGQLSAVVSPDANGEIPYQNITPLSSMGSSAATLLGLSEEVINSDFIMDSTFNAEAANLAFKLHKVAVIYAEVFENAYDYFGENANFPDSASTFVYEAFASLLAGGAALDSAILGNVFDTVDARIVSTFNAIEGEDDIFSQTGASRATAIANANSIAGLIEDAMPSDMTSDQIRARMIGVEMVVAKMTDETPDASAIQAALTEAGNIAGPLYTALSDGLNIDFSELVSIDYSSLDANSFDSVSITGGVSFAELSDKELYVEIERPEKDVSGAALLLFDGESEESTSGDLKLCIKYIDSTVGDDPDYETEGALFKTGEWSKIDDRRVILTLLGGFDFTLISRGVTETNRNLFSMSFAGETETWDTSSDLDAIATNSNAMDSHQDCKDRLTELGS